MLMTIQNLSKCVIAPILATCALKDVTPEVEGRGERGGGEGLGGINVCLSVIPALKTFFFLLCMSCRRRLDKISLLFFTFGSYSFSMAIHRFPQNFPFS